MQQDATKHLEFIQAVITRMAGNSFLLKGWTVTLAAALFALAAADARVAFAAMALFPALSFWGLDAYYLRQERLFRKLYDAVRLASDEAFDKDPFSLSTAKYEKEVECWAETLRAPTVLALHGVVVAVVVLVVLVLSLI